MKRKDDLLVILESLESLESLENLENLESLSQKKRGNYFPLLLVTPAGFKPATF